VLAHATAMQAVSCTESHARAAIVAHVAPWRQSQGPLDTCPECPSTEMDIEPALVVCICRQMKRRSLNRSGMQEVVVKEMLPMSLFTQLNDASFHVLILASLATD
jgi:hypothetical protein